MTKTGDVYKSRIGAGVGEEQWTDEATETLIEGLEEKLKQAGGNLQQRDWQQLADSVNSQHSLLTTPLHCKNRLRTLLNNYKLNPSCPFFSRLHRISRNIDSSKKSTRCLSEAIQKVETIFNKVQTDNQRLSLEIEKQKMLFDKDLEIHRINMFTESQLQLEKIHKATRKRSRYEDDDDDDDALGVMSAFYCLFNA